MPDGSVTVHRADGRVHQQPIRIGGSDPTFLIERDRIEGAVLAPLSPYLHDLLDIVATTFSADGLVRRGGPTRPHLGTDWRRQLEIEVPVSDPEFWSVPERVSALADCLSFMTEDEWRFEFVPLRGRAATAEFFDLQASEGRFEADEVILFSGGLDSLTGAMEVLAKTDRKVVLVTHRSAQKAIPRQNDLGKELARRFSGRVQHIQVRATNVGTYARERTQRSRSMLFGTLGHVVAAMYGAPRVSFYENGVVSQQLPLSPQVVGSMATRTTHPLSLALMKRFFGTLPDGPAALENDYAWLTKTEVVARLVAANGADLIARSVSCTSLREETKATPHCGACSQCLDRRFAILAVGQVGHDPSERYAQDVLLGPAGSDQKLTMSLDWTRHATRMARIDEVGLLSGFAGELERIARGWPNLSNSDVMRRTYQLQRRHGEAVVTALSQAIQDSRTELAEGSLPASSLLRRWIASDDTAALPSMPHDVASLPPGAPSIADQPGGTLGVRFLEKGQSAIVEVVGLGAVSGAPARVAHNLLPNYDEGMESDDPSSHAYVPPGRLGFRSKENVHQAVRRCRRALENFHVAIHGHPPHDPLLIQTGRPQGYRLDPEIEILERTDHS